MLTHFVATSKYNNIFQLQVQHKAEATLFQGQSKQPSICIVNLTYNNSIHDNIIYTLIQHGTKRL